MVATKPTLSIFSGSKGLGVIFGEQSQINVKFIEGNIPLTGTTGNFALDVKGKTRFVTVQGSHDGTGFDGATSNVRLKDFIYEMEDWVTGDSESFNSQASAVYTNGFGETYTVKCFDFSWKRSFSDPSRVLYTLSLHEV